MVTLSGVEPPRSTAIGGHASPPGDKNVTPTFARVARAVWPHNTAAHLAAIAKKDERTGKRWLKNGCNDAIVIAAIINEITKLE